MLNSWSPYIDMSGVSEEAETEFLNGVWVAGPPDNPHFGPWWLKLGWWTLCRGDHIAARVSGDRVFYAPYDSPPWEQVPSMLPDWAFPADPIV